MVDGSSSLESPPQLTCQDDQLRLSLVSGVGPMAWQALLEHFQSAGNVLRASREALLQVPDIGPRVADAILAVSRPVGHQAADVVAQERALSVQHGVQIGGQDSAAYPQMLKTIPDPPCVLYVRGELLPRDNLAIAIVGTRHATSYGKRIARQLAAALARSGFTIVSGLARGIDGAAHLGALDAKGRTLAVSAGSLCEVFPAEHQELAERIVGQGAMISESPLTSPPRRGAFPRRNRLISGLSLGVIVVEAPRQSGALITAQHAAEQGREVFAVPGPIDSRMSAGCHQLLRDGACLVERAEDVLEELGPLIAATSHADGQVVHHPAELQLNDQERQVLAHITPQPVSVDKVAESSGVPIHRVLSTLSVLEMRHLIQRTGGSHVARR